MALQQPIHPKAKKSSWMTLLSRMLMALMFETGEQKTEQASEQLRIKCEKGSNKKVMLGALRCVSAFQAQYLGQTRLDFEAAMQFRSQLSNQKKQLLVDC